MSNLNQGAGYDSYHRVIVNVKNFGALGDGATDDWAAIQEAIDFAVAGAGTGSPLKVYFPAGYYMISQPIWVHGATGTGPQFGIEIEGEGGTQQSNGVGTNATTIDSWGFSSGLYPCFAVGNPTLPGYPTHYTQRGAGSNIWCWKQGEYFFTDATSAIYLAFADIGSILGQSAITFEGFYEPTNATPGDVYNMAAAAGASDSTNQSECFVLTYTVNGSNQGVVTAKLRTTGGTATAVASTQFLTVGTLTHVAVTYDGAHLRLYVNGVCDTPMVLTGTIAQDWYNVFAIGAYTTGYPQQVNQPQPHPLWMGSIRMCNQVQYTGSSFSPPTADLVNVANHTLILLNFDPSSTLSSSGARDGWVKGLSSAAAILGHARTTVSTGAPVWLRIFGSTVQTIRGVQIRNLYCNSYSDAIYAWASLEGHYHHISCSGLNNRGITLDSYSYNSTITQVTTALGGQATSGINGCFYQWGIASLHGVQMTTVRQWTCTGGSWQFVGGVFSTTSIHESYGLACIDGFFYVNSGDLICFNILTDDEGTSGGVSVAAGYFVSCNNVQFYSGAGLFIGASGGSTFVPTVIIDQVSTGIFNSGIAWSSGSLGMFLFKTPNGFPIQVNSGLGTGSGPMINPAGFFGPLILPNQEMFGALAHNIDSGNLVTNVYTLPQNDFFWGTLEITDNGVSPSFTPVLIQKTNILLPTNTKGYTRRITNSTAQILVLGGNLGVGTVVCPIGGSIEMVSTDTGWEAIPQANQQAALTAVGVGNWIGAVGGDTITIYGTGFVPNTSPGNLAFTVTDGSMVTHACTNVQYQSSTTCTATAPAISGVASPTSTFALSGTNGDGTSLTAGHIDYEWDPSQLLGTDLVVWYEIGINTTVSGGHITKVAPASAASGYALILVPLATTPTVLYSPNGINGRPAMSTPVSGPTILSPNNGTAATVTNTGGTVTVSGLANMVSTDAGKRITITGSSQATNVGVWPIVSVNTSAQTCVITNPAAITDTGGDAWNLNFSSDVASPFTVHLVARFNSVFGRPGTDEVIMYSQTYAQVTRVVGIDALGSPIINYPFLGSSNNVDGGGISPSFFTAGPTNPPFSELAVFNGASSLIYFNNGLGASGNTGSADVCSNVYMGTNWTGYIASVVVTNDSVSPTIKGYLSVYAKTRYGTAG